MKVAFYSDLHIYNHHRLLINSETSFNILSYIKEFCIENGITKVFSLGDFFHTKAKAYAPHVIQAWLKLKEFYKAGIEHTMIIGNHDMANPNNTMNSILFVFSDYCKIVPDYSFLDIDNVRLHLMSYTNTMFKDFIYHDKKKNILLGHLDIIGFQMTNGFEASEGYKISDFDQFYTVFSGHYHKHQTKRNIVYVGSPYQTSFGERDQKHGFVVFDTETLEWEFVEIDIAPKYKVLEINKLDDLTPDVVQNNFLKVKLNSGDINKLKLKEKLIELGAISVDIIPLEDSKEIEKYYDRNISDKPEEIAKSYLDSINNLSMDKHKLLKYFTKIEEVSNNITDYEV